MLEDFLKNRIKCALPFTPNEEQEEALHLLSSFIISCTPRKVFVLKGYAGTGKTSLLSALVQTLKNLNQRTFVLAPTGRAAKVFSSFSGHPAYTIHKKIYRQKTITDQRFEIDFNNTPNTLFIIDEASMIANQVGDNASFGSGRLLDDLVQYVYSSDGCSMILIGDDAQLPPVGQSLSPALDIQTLKSYDLQVSSYTLTKVARQALESGILKNATMLRDQIASGQTNDFPIFQLQEYHPSSHADSVENHPDICKLSGEEVLDELERAYDEVGEEGTIVITRTNKRMNLYNQGIRNRILWREDEICINDRIMVTKNNYFWSKDYEGVDFLANGDIFKISRLRNFHEQYGNQFAEASLMSVDYAWEIDVMLWLNTLRLETQEASYAMQRELFDKIALDYPDIHNRKELVKKIMESPYYNALHIKHAYAVTCHKAQGGQWDRIFIDQGVINSDTLGVDYYRWLYTALTRAKEQVFLINF